MVIRFTLLTTFKNMIQHYNYSHWASQVALVVKNPPANPGDSRNPSLIPGSGGSPGGRHGNPLQYPCLENPTDRSLVGYSPWGGEESDTTEWLSSHAIIVTWCMHRPASPCFPHMPSPRQQSFQFFFKLSFFRFHTWVKTHSLCLSLSDFLM